ncbi:MAG: class IV adenylate cyclase, partial [Burkholderiales bacterium]|nr:class IV adenylate cyclase [Burkholderiales bacterium]
KFRVHDDRSLRKSLRELGARLVSTFDQRDQYMLHPSRDFRETDEAFRIRVEGESATLTYKGPKMDRQTKTRPEIEVALKHVGELDRAVQLLE